VWNPKLDKYNREAKLRGAHGKLIDQQSRRLAGQLAPFQFVDSLQRLISRPKSASKIAPKHAFKNQSGMKKIRE